MRSVKADHRLNPLTIAVMREIDELAKELKLSYFVCGAMARDILLKHIHDIKTEIATEDVDFGIAVESWAQFENIKARLTSTGRFEPVKNKAQCLNYKLNAGTAGYPVDIIPFRGVEQPLNSVAWPPDKGNVMNVIGYEDVLATALQVEVESSFVVPVISLPGLALLKLFAWNDRGSANRKDARDLVLLFREYFHAGNEDRIYGDALDILEALEYDIELAGVRLLGRDVRAIAAEVTRKQIDDLIGNAAKMDKLISHIAASLPRSEDQIAGAERYLEQFKAGLTGQ